MKQEINYLWENKKRPFRVLKKQTGKNLSFAHMDWKMFFGLPLMVTLRFTTILYCLGLCEHLLSILAA